MFAALVWAAGTPAHAQENQVQRGPAPAWVKSSELMPVPENASGLAFVRRQDVLINLDKQGQEQYAGYRIKLLHPNALQLGNLAINWNPASGHPTVHTIKIYRGDQVIDVLDKASFEILRREDQLEAATLTGQLTAVLRVPDLRVGDELEFNLTLRLKDPVLGDNDAGLLLIAPSTSPGRYRLALSWADGLKPNLKMTADMAAVATPVEDGIEFPLENPPILVPPNDAPARYAWQRVVEYSDFSDWAAISKHFAPLYSRSATLTQKSSVKSEAARIAAAYASPYDRASAALKMVQQDVRYIYVGLDGGNWRPATADETWQRRYGDCKGKTALLMALLSELGISAEAVLVNNGGTDDGLDERLAIPGLFDHVLVRALIDGKRYWLDGTLPPVASPALDPVIPYRWVLPISAAGSALERIEWRPAQRPEEISLFEIDARAGFDQPAKITNTTIIRGIKALEQQIAFSGLTQQQLHGAFSERMIGNTWQSIDDVQWRYDQKAHASVLTITGMGAVNWDDGGDGEKSLALPGGGFSPPPRRVRAASQKQDLPYYNKPEFSCYVTTVRLPTATHAKQWSFEDAYDTRIFGRNYYRAFELRDGVIRMVRGYRVEQNEIDAASAMKDNDRIAQFDNSMAWIYFDPAGGNSIPRSGKSVPATYEFDWTADSVPCRSRSAAP